MGQGDFGYHESFPDGVRDVFMWLSQELAGLSVKWKLYIDLYGEEENRGLLHDTAHHAFEVIEEALRVDITMTICRMADPIQSCGAENLSLARLPGHFASDAALKAAIDKFRSDCKPFVTHRNKLIAHNDLKTKLDPENHRLPGIGRSDIDRVFGSAGRILNHLAGRHADTDMLFDGPSRFDGRDLIHHLKKARALDLRERGELG